MRKNNIPKELSGKALEWWNITVPELEKTKQLSELDRTNLIILANCYDNMILAMDQLKKYGYTVIYSNGSEQLSQFHSMFQQNASLYNKIGAAYGLTPAARLRLKLDADSIEEDAISKFLK